MDESITTTPQLRDAWIERRGYWVGVDATLRDLNQHPRADAIGRGLAYEIGVGLLKTGVGNQLPSMLRGEVRLAQKSRDEFTDQFMKEQLHSTVVELERMVAEADVVDANRGLW